MRARKEKPSVDLLTEGLTNLPREVIGPYGSVQVFIRKPIATSDFQVVRGPLDPPMRYHHVAIISISRACSVLDNFSHKPKSINTIHMKQKLILGYVLY